MLLLFDVYLTWARIEKQSVPEPGSSSQTSNLGSLAQQPIVFQYMFFRKYTHTYRILLPNTVVYIYPRP